MKRIGIMGLCAVAMLALCAMVSAAAQAAEVASCVKAPKVAVEYEKSGKVKTKRISEGKYKNKGCSEAAPENTGKYPPYAGPEGRYERGAAGARFSTRSTKALKKPKLEVVENGQIVQCTASGGSGEWTGPKAGVQTVVFKGCALETGGVSGEKCTSEGMAAGEIETTPLELTLISYPEALVQEYFGPENELLGSEAVPYVPGKVFVDTAPQAGQPYAAFECGAAASFRILGSVAGHVTSELNTMSKRLDWYVGPGEYVQNLRGEYSSDGGATYEPLGRIWESYEPAAADGAGLEVLEPNA